MLDRTGKTDARAADRAFTLIEAVVSLAVVATMVVVALEMLGASAKVRVAQTEQSRATALARQLLCEIMQHGYTDPDFPGGFGPGSTEDRTTFDDVDDFNGYSESPPCARSGALLPGYAGWTRRVDVAWANPSSPQDSSGSETGLKRIVVTVTSPTDRVTALTALRSRNSGYDQMPPTDRTYVSWAGAAIQVGTDPNTRAVSGVNLVNQVP